MKKTILLFIYSMILIVILTSCHANKKFTYNNEDILEFIGVEDLNCEVINIEEQKKAPLTIFAELYVSEKEFAESEYFQRKQEFIAPGIIKDLEAYGVKLDSIIEFGINYKDFIIKQNGNTEYRPYYIYWYKLPQNTDNKSNILIYAILPNEENDRGRFSVS